MQTTLSVEEEPSPSATSVVRRGVVRTCKIKLDDGSTTTAFLKEVSAPTLADFKYYNADGSVFDGTVVSSDTNIRFLLSRIEKGIR